jgi:hypothetical protein
MIIRTNVKVGSIVPNHNEKIAKDNKYLAINTEIIDKNRRDLIKMLSLTGVAGLLTVAQSLLLPVIFASTPKAAGTTIVKARSLQGLRLPTDSNAIISELRPGKAEVRFPKGIGYIRPGRNEFKDHDDIASYLSEAFPLIKEDKGGYRGSIKRVGKYQRLNEYNRTVFTFGDPVLDLITDENGILILGGTRIDLRVQELEDLEQRGGGILGMDPPVTTDPPPPTEPPAGCKSHTLWFPSSSASPRMRFRAWSKYYEYIFKWTEGTDIETWGRDFKNASIVTKYGAYGNSAAQCKVTMTDSDGDTNDDYLDEYEYGFNPYNRPFGHLSMCYAEWNNGLFSESVCEGCTQGWI